LVVFVILVFAVIHGIFGSATTWILSGFVALMWLRAFFSGGLVAKLIWSIVLLFTVFTVWTSYGCIGNAQYCVDLQAQHDADNKKAAIAQAQKDMEWCAEKTDWQSDSTCRIYTRKEIDDAKARTAARAAADAAEERNRLQQEEQQRVTEAIKNRDLARSAGDQK
jgi:energy-coupling factor transporter transmembrane protein EcfT